MPIHIDRIAVMAVRLGHSALGDSIVAWKGENAYVLSYDRTTLATCRVSPVFDGEIRFRATDYIGQKVRVNGTRAVFTSSSKIHVTVVMPPETFSLLDEMFSKFVVAEDGARVLLGQNDLTALDEDVAHVEIGWRHRQCYLFQRDVFTGRVVTIGPLVGSGHEGARPIAVRTLVLQALASISSSLVVVDCGQWFRITGDNGLEAVVGACLYDSLAEITTLIGEEKNGRKEQ